MQEFNNDNHKGWLKVDRLALETARDIYNRNYHLKSENCFEIDDVKQQVLLWYLEWVQLFKNNNEFKTPSDSFRYCCNPGWLGWRVSDWTRRMDFGSMSGHHDVAVRDYKDSPHMFSVDKLLPGRSEGSNTINMTEKEEKSFVHPSVDPAEEFQAERDREIVDKLALEFLSDKQYLIYVMVKQGYSGVGISKAIGDTTQRISKQKIAIINILRENI